MNLFADKIFSILQNKFGNLPSLESEKNFCFKNLTQSLKSFLVFYFWKKYKHQIFFVANSNEDASKIFDDLTNFVEIKNLLLLEEKYFHQNSISLENDKIEFEIVKLLFDDFPKIIISSPQIIFKKIYSPKKINQEKIEITKKQNFSYQKLIETLQNWNYHKVDFTQENGEFAVRGGIIDVFSFGSDFPYRLEFFGDEISSIREFDIKSQRSILELEKTNLFPNLLNSENEICENIFESLQKNTIVFWDEKIYVQKFENENINPNLFSFSEIENFSKNFTNINLSQIEKNKNEIDFYCISQPNFNNSIVNFFDYTKKLVEQNYIVFVGSSSNEEKNKLYNLISLIVEEKHFDEKILNSIYFLNKNLNSGFILQNEKIAFFTEHQIFEREKRKLVTKRKPFHGISLKELMQLKYGDYVVHIDYGVGKFGGLTKINIGNKEEEVAKISYRGNDLIYVNIQNIHRIKKYSSKEGHTPQITKLGKGEWEKLKLKAKRKIKDIAKDLIQTYAKKKMAKGFAFSKDTVWQKELEASFYYEDTPDQTKSTWEVKQDMENDFPMDRLICGDVGFGKTEVAIRASFKSVQDSFQVAVLVPTTILSLQHLNTFKDRLEKYAVNIECLTRFNSKKEQKEILEKLKNGKIDIIIGTHRLFSKDVEFKNLGLLIIDEEHRFGVSAKEILRQKREHIDTLTLTATPIPRTLNFSLLGIKDLSMITTPPKNRLPIETEISQFNEKIISEGILFELNRKGQVYFVNDKVHNLENIKSTLEKYVPSAKFGIAHGQMKGNELEKVILNFLEKKMDVLICTKIIEAGVDIPNTNTIFINNAHHFGMAELYQLRGRVGRSNIQSYAYFLTPPFSSLAKHSIKKLLSLQEFSELGSGFFLSMRDMEIRGSGNLLGADQSGFILEMGFETYEKILNETILELQNEEISNFWKHKKIETEIDTIIECDIESLIPNFYISNDAERFSIYQKLSSIRNENEIDELKLELKDRFGNFPNELKNLFDIVSLRIYVGEIGFKKISIQKNQMVLDLPNQTNSQFYDGKIFQNILNNVKKGNTISFLNEKNPKLKTTLSYNLKNEKIKTAKEIITKLIG